MTHHELLLLSPFSNHKRAARRHTLRSSMSVFLLMPFVMRTELTYSSGNAVFSSMSPWVAEKISGLDVPGAGRLRMASERFEFCSALDCGWPASVRRSLAASCASFCCCIARSCDSTCLSSCASWPLIDDGLLWPWPWRMLRTTSESCSSGLGMVCGFRLAVARNTP